VAIAREYACRDKRVRIHVNETNLGLVGNWNRCVELAAGEWIKFLFQDDLLALTCVERLFDLGQSRNIPVVACRRDFMFEEGTSDEMRDFYLASAAQIEDVFRHSQEMSAVVCRRVVLDRIGGNLLNLLGEPTATFLHHALFSRFGYFNPVFISICDLEYWSRIGIHVGALYTPEILASFRVHRGSVSAGVYAGRSYRLELDGLVLFHEYLFHPLYKILWATGSHRWQMRDLIGAVEKKAQKARQLAELAATDLINPDTVPLLEWKDVVRHYPRLDRLSRPYSCLYALLWRLAIRTRSFP